MTLQFSGKVYQKQAPGNLQIYCLPLMVLYHNQRMLRQLTDGSNGNPNLGLHLCGRCHSKCWLYSCDDIILRGFLLNKCSFKLAKVALDIWDIDIF